MRTHSVARPWIGFLLLVAACEVAGLYSVSRALGEAYRDAKIRVALTDGLVLTVTFTESPLTHASCDSQVSAAMHVAAIVRDHYTAFDSLQRVDVAFAAGPNARLPLRFARTAISSGLGAADSTRAVETCRSYEELQR